MAVPVPSRPFALRFGPYTVDMHAGELRKHGTRVKLQERPFQILRILLEQPGEVVSREELRSRLWPEGTFVDFDHGISSAVRKLREALCDSAATPRYIETVGRRGYRFIDVVENLSAGPKQPSAIGMDSTRSVLPSPSDTAPSRWIAGMPARLRWTFLALLPFLAAALITGAFLSSHHAAVLTDRDAIVLADFTNTTGDPIFDNALRQGLAVELAQSPFLSIVSEQRMQDTLRLMGQPSGVRVTPEIARELCERTESTSVVDGSIARLGNQYVLGLKAVNCRSGDTLAEEQTTASGKERVLRALGASAKKLRRKLGESISTIERFDTPLEQATTPSLEALKIFSLGAKALGSGEYENATSLFQRALALDPNFAMAYTGLSAAYADLGESGLAAESARRAYALRDRVSERERLNIEAAYEWGNGDLEKTRREFELMVQTYPRDSGSHFDLGNVYSGLGQYEKGLAEARESLRLDPAYPLTYAYLVTSYRILNRLNEAQATAEEAEAKRLDSPPLHFELYVLAFLRNDAAEMNQQVAWSAGKPGAEDVLQALEAATAAYRGQLRKARELSRQAVASAQRERQEAAGFYEADAALREAFLGNSVQARQRAEAALRLSTNQVVEYGAALALARVRERARAQALVDDLAKRFPEDTLVQFNYVPTIHAQLALSDHNASEAIAALQASTLYEMGTPGTSYLAPDLYPILLRGEAYLAAHRADEAVVEFEKLSNRTGLLFNRLIGPLAHRDLARAYAMRGDTGEARATYDGLLTLWKDADPDLPILQQLKVEYAKLR